MVKVSIDPTLVNGSRMTEEMFSENVAFLRENIDHMFVLLMGAITCFLQVLHLIYFGQPFTRSFVFQNEPPCPSKRGVAIQKALKILALPRLA